MGTRKDRARKQAQRAAHANRKDNRHPDQTLTMDEVRNIFRDMRRETRRLKRISNAEH